MLTQIIITDEELTKMLEKSYLDFDQKLNLIPLIPAMDAKEREGLLDLIKQAEEIQKNKKNYKLKYQEGLKKLNKEYNHKMDQMVKDSANLARREFEKLAHNKDTAGLVRLEEEINNINQD